jgi:predicted ATPase
MKRRLFNGHNSSSTTAMRPQFDFSKLKTDYGREKELEQLVQIYDCVSISEEVPTQVVVVHGSSGTGKISLCRSFRDKVSPIYVEGKFDQLAKEPYSGFGEAFTQLASEFSDTNAGEIARIQKAYLAELEAVPKVKFLNLSCTPEADDGSLDDGTPLNDSTFSNTKPSVLSQRAVSMSSQAQSFRSMVPTSLSASFRAQSVKRHDSQDLAVSISSAGARVSNQLTTATDITSLVPSLRRLIPDIFNF